MIAILIFVVHDIDNHIELAFINKENCLGRKISVLVLILGLFLYYQGYEVVEIGVVSNYRLALIQNLKTFSVHISEVFRSYDNNIICLGDLIFLFEIIS